MTARPALYRKSRRARNPDDYETWINDAVSNTLTPFDASPARATVLAVVEIEPRPVALRGRTGGTTAEFGGASTAYALRAGQGGADKPYVLADTTPGPCGCCPDDPQPDGPRYRALGNAVSVPVAESIGRRLRVKGWPPGDGQDSPSPAGITSP